MVEESDFKSRAAAEVVKTLMDCSRRPGSNEVELNTRDAMDALCQAIALVAATTAHFDPNVEKAASLIETLEEHVSERLHLLANEVRRGALLTKQKPTLRIVK